MIRRIDWVFLLLLAVAALLRVHLALTQPYIHDEENTAIPLSKTISFDPEALNLPIRGENHGAMPAYVVKVSSSLFGTTRIGYRTVHIALGLCTIVLVYALARQWYGPVAACWAAAILAFNEYYLTISARATAHVPHFFFVALALFFFARFLRRERPASLYAAGAALGLAFYCKEHSALILPVFLLTLLQAKYHRWLRTPHVYLAGVVFLLVIGPDIAWNLRTNPETARVTYSGQPLGQATYSAHLRRLGGIGFSPYPSMFYARRQVMSLHQRLTGRALTDETPEYRSMNPALGLLLVGSVVATTVATSDRTPVRTFLLLLFWCVFGFFTLVKKGNPPYRLDPVSWIWVEVTMLPATVLAGARLAGVDSRPRFILWTAAAGALAYAAYASWPVPE